MNYYVRRVIAFYLGNFRKDRLQGLVRVTFGLTLTLIRPLVVRIGQANKYCPCCGWRGSRFMPFLATGYISFNTLCPVCASSPRHRAHRLFYERYLHFSKRQGTLLYFAPERNLVYFKENKNLIVKTSDYPTGDTDYNIDIMNIPFKDDEWDYIVCHRVIEHLRDDRFGLGEFFRILKPGGFAIISVPIDGARERTIEYGKPNALENEHYYSYGTDFASRIPPCFEVEVYRFSEIFSGQEYVELALIEDYVFVCRKPISIRVLPQSSCSAA
jgi:SAM-dependent methyltransferase